MPECIFTCRRCGYRVAWNNSYQQEPTCSSCRSGGRLRARETEEYQALDRWIKKKSWQFWIRKPK